VITSLANRHDVDCRVEEFETLHVVLFTAIGVNFTAKLMFVKAYPLPREIFACQEEDKARKD